MKDIKNYNDDSIDINDVLFPVDGEEMLNPEYEPIDGCEDGNEVEEPIAELTIMSALDYIQEKAHHSKLKGEFWQQCERYFEYLCEKLELNRNQVLITAILCETGEHMSWRRIGNFLGVSRLKALTFSADVDDMKRRRLVVPCCSHENQGRYEAIKLAPKTIKAFRHNEKFVPENISGLTEQAFVDRLVRYVSNEGDDCDITRDENHLWMTLLVEANKHLPLYSVYESLEEESSHILLLLAIVDYALYVNNPSLGLTLGQLNRWFDAGWMFDQLADDLREGRHELFEKGIFEYKCDNGLVDNEKYVLTSNIIDSVLGEFAPHKKKGRQNDRDLLAARDIVLKPLFYNSDLQSQIKRLESLLSEDGLKAVQDRLESVGMRKGIACLFYGTPGTGKTETVLQLARETGRDVMQVNIANIRDKFVGESEKNIKGIFDRYRSLCADRALTPILLFNEADALINNRLVNTQSSVEKMDNAIQNILLEEMEKLDGIMIATTNLTGNLDRAFDRRFLFKVEFGKPGPEVKKSIWHSMLPSLDGEACGQLAGEFDFSGGQIENIVRKCNIEYVLTGREMTVDDIRSFCREERINRSTHAKIGF